MVFSYFLSYLQDDDFLNLSGFEATATAAAAAAIPGLIPKPETAAAAAAAAPPPYQELTLMQQQQQQPSNDDLLNICSLDSPQTIPALITEPNTSASTSGAVISLLGSHDLLPTLSRQQRDFSDKMVEQKSSRQRGLDELDFLGESAIQSVLQSTTSSSAKRSPQFAKNEKVPLSQLQMQQRDLDLRQPLNTGPHQPSAAVAEQSQQHFPLFQTCVLMILMFNLP